VVKNIELCDIILSFLDGSDVMGTKKRNIALLYRIVILIVTGFALYLNFRLLGFKTGILYFTNLSNLLCFVYFLILVIMMILKKDNDSDLHYIVKGMVTMAITLTMFVYNFVLASDSNAFKNHMLECNLVHLVVPLFVIFDYIIFGVKGNLKKTYPFIWTAVLFVYEIFIMIYIFLGGTFANGDKYPYFYMDVTKYGMLGVILNSFIILVLYIIYGELIQVLDNKVGNYLNVKRKNN